MKLNLGCGNKRVEGYAGVDAIKTDCVDFVHDLNMMPYPFAENSIDGVVMDNVLEHLDDVIRVMEEVYRICRNGAIVRVNVPYFKSNSAFTDPTHKHFFSETSFKYFDSANPLHFYTQARFETVSASLICHTEYRDLKHFLRNILPFKKVLNYFLFNIYDEVVFELKCIKD